MGRFNIRLKRAYQDAESSDGVRILVDRLWPRGVTKKAAAIDHWLKEVAPSPELRKWFGHQPQRWSQFRERYSAELDEKQQQLAELQAICEKGTVTFVFAARDTSRNGAIVLKDYLERHTAVDH